MAFGEVYHGTIDVRRPSGGVVDVYLLKEGYGGSVSPMRLASNALDEQGARRDSKEMVPLRPRKGTLRLHPSEAGVLQAVYADETPWRIRIEVGGQVDLVGPIRKQLRTASDDKFVTSALQLKWNDGLGPLKEVDFDQDDDAPYDGRRSIIGWVTELLRKTGLGLDVAAASEWYTPSMDGGSPLEQEYLEPDRYVTEDGPMSAFDVLEDLAAGKGAFLCQERGRWHFYQRALYRSDSFQRWVYPSGWTDGDAAPTAETYQSYVDVSDDFSARRKGSESPARRSYPRVDVTYKHQTIDNLLPAWYRTEPRKDPVTGIWESAIFSDWAIPSVFTPSIGPNQDFEVDVSLDDTLTKPEPSTFDGWYSAYVKDFDSSKTVDETLGEAIALQDGRFVEAAWNAVRMSFDAYFFLNQDVLASEDEEAYPNLAYAQVVLEGTDGTTYYLRRQVSQDGDSYTYQSPTWTTDATSYVTFIVEPNRAQTVEVRTPSLPADGSLTVEMYGAIDQKPSLLPDQDADGNSVTEYRFNLPTLLPVNLSDEQPSEQLVSCRVGGEDGEVYEIDVLHGTGPTGAHPGASWTGPGDTATLTDDWKVGPYSGGSDTGLTAAQILAREALYQLHETRDVLAWTLLEDTPSLTKAAKLPGGERYLPVYKRTRYQADHQEVEAVRLRRQSGLSISYVSRTNETSDAGSSGGGGGGPASGGSATWPVQGTPDEIFSRSGEGGTVTLADTDITGALGYTPASDVPGTGLAAEGSHQLGIAADGVTGREIAASAVGDGLTGGGGSALAVDAPSIAGDGLQGDGSNDLAVDAPTLAGDGLQGDGSNDLAVDGTVARINVDETFEQDVTIMGSLTVNGDEVVQNTQTVEVEDNLFLLNAGETGSGVTRGAVGLEADRGTEPPVKLIFDESGDVGRIGVEYRTIQYSGLSGSFQLHEEIVGQSSGAKALIWYDSSGTLRTKGRTSTFTSGETIVGQTSGASATIDSISTYDQTQRLAALEDAPQDGAVAYWDAGAEHLASVPSLSWTGSVLDLDAPLEADDLVEHPQHVDKRQRWSIDAQGRADFRRLYTDELVAKTFTVDLTQALAGSDYLVKSVATLDAAFTVPAAASADGAVDGGTGTLTVRDNPGAKGVAPFASGDWLRLRVVDNSDGGLTIVDAWVVVQSITDNGDGTHSFGVQRGDTDSAATGKTIQTDAAVLDYGQSGQGLIRRTVEGPDAPYAAIETWSGNPVQGGSYTTQAALGDLSGFSGTNVSPSGYGLYSENAYLEGEIVAGSGEIGGWLITGEQIGSQDGEVVIRSDGLTSGETVIYTQGDDESGAQNWLMVGNFYDHDLNKWVVDEQGIFFDDSAGNRFFELTTRRKEIAGWEFEPSRFVNYDIAGTGVDVNLGSRPSDPKFYGLHIVTSNGAQLFKEVDDTNGRVFGGLYANQGDDRVMYGNQEGANGGIGLHVQANGTTVLQTDEDGTAYVDALEVRSNATVQGDAVVDGTITASKIAAGTITATEISGSTITADQVDTDALFTKTFTLQSGGIIQNAGGDFRLSDDGFIVEVAGTYAPENAYLIQESDTDKGLFWADSFANETRLEARNGHDMILDSEDRLGTVTRFDGLAGGDRVLSLDPSFGAFSEAGIVLEGLSGGHSSHPTVSEGEAVIYVLQDSNSDDLEIWAAVRHGSGDDGQLYRTRLVG